MLSTTIVCQNEWKQCAQLDLDLDQSLEPVCCFPGELNQVVLNLIVNAAHSIQEKRASGSPELGRIAVSTKNAGVYAEIRVRDSGTGIPKESRSKVFDPFFTTKEIGKGTGQGLAMVHSIIVEKHPGELTFETEVGQGTTFLVRIPTNPAA